ncbi:MAG: hypothetical protein JXR96_25595 [Deltaproteobacteria bacterium]|nr:hypothetical protein [Deltaproteobacteria bacterium]
MAQLRRPPGCKLTKADKRVMNSIHKKHPIDRTTFCNTTPSPDSPQWIEGLRRYRAMDRDWITRDPPGPPCTFYVTRANEVFRSVAEALTSMRHSPKDDEEALKAAILIAKESAHHMGKVITSRGEKVEGLPEDTLAKTDIAPRVEREDRGYRVTVFSHVSNETQNKFVRGYHALWKHVITIRGHRFEGKTDILWEKRD